MDGCTRDRVVADTTPTTSTPCPTGMERPCPEGQCWQRCRSGMAPPYHGTDLSMVECTTDPNSWTRLHPSSMSSRFTWPRISPDGHGINAFWTRRGTGRVKPRGFKQGPRITASGPDRAPDTRIHRSQLRYRRHRCFHPPPLNGLSCGPMQDFFQAAHDAVAGIVWLLGESLDHFGQLLDEPPRSVSTLRMVMPRPPTSCDLVSRAKPSG